MGVRGSFANSLPLDGTTPPDSHMPSLPSANSTLFPAKASGSMQYLRIPAGTSPIPTDCVRALPPLRLAATNRWTAACRSCRSPFPAVRPGQQAVIFAEPVRRTNDAGAGHDFAEHFLAVVGRFCGREKPSSLRANPLRTRMEVWLQSRHEEKTRLAQLVADSSELGIWRERGMRVVHSKIQILGWVVLSYQDDHKIRVPKAGKNRFLIQGMKWNRIHFTSISRLFQMADFVISATMWNQAGHF